MPAAESRWWRRPGEATAPATLKPKAAQDGESKACVIGGGGGLRRLGTPSLADPHPYPGALQAEPVNVNLMPGTKTCTGAIVRACLEIAPDFPEGEFQI